MVADGLWIVNTDYSRSSFRVSRVRVGRRNFIGNNIAFPARARTGDNTLLATKVLVPVDGELRENVGLLGSPSFEIPRTVERDRRFDHRATGDELRRNLRAKNRHNTVTMGLFLLSRWVYVVASCACPRARRTSARLARRDRAAGVARVLLFTIAFSALVERAGAGFPAAAAPVLLDLRPTSGGTSATGR